jgi:hypothetical protein
MNIWGFIIGTAILWGSKLISLPLARVMAGSRIEKKVVGEGEKKQEVEIIPLGPYILADVLVLGILGFLLGLLVGWFFIGISWRARDWPGMIVFIGLSVLGTVLHG